jgi:hypothetical protein
MLMDQQIEYNKRMEMQQRSQIQLGKEILNWPHDDEYFDMVEVVMKSNELVSD